ncbi:flagellar assembly protein FliH [Evansella caseinilytica]|uniref:Flagellar assembly protein FliH n=1 Tax=Evansella caseinilytica TaxID=1503961 RepID=A0A1H3M623_9BACI|nr:flagellar assembly protein FliH [Evansella caseinilytica]
MKSSSPAAEEMISLSKLIKSMHAKRVDDGAITIKVKPVEKPPVFTEDGNTADDDRQQQRVHYLERDRILTEAEQEANRMLEEVRREVADRQEELRLHEEEIKKEAEQRFLQAEEEGRRQGYEAGLLEGRNAYDEEILKAQEVVEKAKLDYFQHIENAEPVMLELAMTVAKKIVGTALSENREAWLFILKEVIEDVRGRGEINIYVHPDRYELTLHHQDELKQIALHSAAVYIYPKADLPENGCIVETPFGQVDASVDSQLKELKRKLLEKLNEGENHETH